MGRHCHVQQVSDRGDRGFLYARTRHCLVLRFPIAACPLIAAQGSELALFLAFENRDDLQNIRPATAAAGERTVVGY